MLDLLNDDFDKVPLDNWEHLFNVFQSQEKILRSNIMNEKSPKKKEKTAQALNTLLSVLENYIRQKNKFGSIKRKQDKKH